MFVGLGTAKLGLDKRSKLGCGRPTFLYGLFQIGGERFSFPPTSFSHPSLGMSTAMRGSGLGLAFPPRCEREAFSHRTLQRIFGDFAMRVFMCVRVRRNTRKS